MAKGDELEERLIEFAVRIVKLCNAMPKNAAGRHLGNQLVRSGTSPAFNYGEARAAESKRDFVHKIMDECDQLCRISNASIQTALGKTNNVNDKL